MRSSWVHDAIRNFDYRLRLPEDKRGKLDALILALQDESISSHRQVEIHKEVEEILDTGVGERPAGRAVADAAKKGFNSHFDGKE